MAIVKEKVPYEYLVRMDKNGKVGQHIKYITRVYDDATGEVFAEIEGNAEPVDTTDNSVPLETAIGAVSAQVAKSAAIAGSEKAEAEAARDVAITEKQAKAAELAALQFTLDERTAERDAKAAELEAEKGKNRK